MDLRELITEIQKFVEDADVASDAPDGLVSAKTRGDKVVATIKHLRILKQQMENTRLISVRVMKLLDKADEAIVFGDVDRATAVMREANVLLDDPFFAD